MKQSVRRILEEIRDGKTTPEEGYARLEELDKDFGLFAREGSVPYTPQLYPVYVPPNYSPQGPPWPWDKGPSVTAPPPLISWRSQYVVSANCGKGSTVLKRTSDA